MSDSLASNARNQHFITQAEQRLNARNPGALPENQRLYSFRVIDRDRDIVELEEQDGRPIRRNLSALDLFSFDVPEAGAMRLNFEKLFERYEATVAARTESLLAKLANHSRDIGVEVVDLFAAKLLNFVRNPYCIRKVLNSFPGLAGFEPTDPALRALYERIIQGRRPHQAVMCADLGISDTDYGEWLRTLFMLLAPVNGQSNLFEDLIQRLIENPDTHATAIVCSYDEKVCLLSDRGYCEPIEDGAHMAFSFNLSRHAFMHYMFANVADLTKDWPAREHAMSTWARMKKSLDVRPVKNNLDLLKMYNHRAIEQCHERVFCAAKSFDALGSS